MCGGGGQSTNTPAFMCEMSSTIPTCDGAEQDARPEDGTQLRLEGKQAEGMEQDI